MAFLSPWFLLAFLGVGIPIAIHMIRKEKSKPVVFSTLRFLKKVPKKRVLFQQIQQRLLLLLRILIIALIALAFARPFLTGALSELAGVAPQSVAIVLDTSMSMHYGDSFEKGKQAAQQILESLNPGDEAALITFTDEIGQARELTTELSELETFLHQLTTPSFRSTQFLSALRLANEMLHTATYQDRKIYLISDYQMHAFENFDPSWSLDAGIALETISVGNEATQNLTISDAKWAFSQTSEPSTLLARVSSQGTVHIDEAKVSVNLNGEILATQVVNLRDQSEAIVEFPIELDSLSPHLLTVEVEDGAFPLDNQYFLTIGVQTHPKILGIYHRFGKAWYEDQSHWLRMAMENNTISNFKFEMTKETITSNLLAEFDTLVLFDAEFTSTELNAIRDFVRQGKSLILVPSPETSQQQFNSFFGQLSPASLNQKQEFDRENYVIVSETQNRHPIFHTLETNQVKNFSNAQFWGYWSVRPTADSTPLMIFDNGTPFLLEKRVSAGRAFLFTSPLDTTWNNLPVQMEFLPLIHETFRYLTMDSKNQASYSVGDVIPIPLTAGALTQVSPPQAAFELGSTEQLIPTLERPVYEATDFPGFYQVRSKNLQSHFAVNVPEEESNFTLISPTAIKDAVINPETTQTKTAVARAALQEAQLENSQRFWWGILLLVFILVLGETLLANRTYR